MSESAAILIGIPIFGACLILTAFGIGKRPALYNLTIHVFTFISYVVWSFIKFPGEEGQYSLMTLPFFAISFGISMVIGKLINFIIKKLR